MPQKKEFEDIIYVRGLKHRAKTINAIADKHRIDHVELARGLVEAACDFFEEHGFFSFPVRVEPEAFQRQWLEVAEESSSYGAPAKALNESVKVLKARVQTKDKGDGAGRKRRQAKPGAAP